MSGSALSVEYGGQIPAAPGEGESLLDWYRWWCARDPDAPAVEEADVVWTYAELDALADQTADNMGAKVRPGDVVGVCLDRSVAIVVVAVAIAKLGAVYLPLGPRVAPQRLDMVLRTLRVSCLVDDSGRMPHSYAADRIPVLPPDGAAAGLHPLVAGFATPPAAAAAAPEEAFYAVLTSGTTGGPKVITVGERSLANLVRWYCAYVELHAGERHSLLYNPAFDPHLLDLWGTLCCGACVSVPPPEIQWDPQAVLDWWSRAGVTVASMPAPLGEAVLDRPWPAGLALSHLVIGGDRLRRWPSAEVTAEVHNVYGPAEATVVTTACTLRAMPTDESEPPIGRPVPGAIVCVTDAAGQIVPRGESGELRIGGTGLALGCINGAQAEPFVPSPDGLAGVERVYRSGDRVRMRADGVMEFLGRLDDQVKVSGVRIEPTEVEMAFERDPRVRRAIVVARRTGDGTVRLVAFIQPDPDCGPTETQVIAAVRAWLPEQAVPAVVHFVESIPLTANGKIDRSALLALEAPPAGTSDSGNASAPTPIEDLVLGLCRDLLGRPLTVLTDRFTDVGGNSLMTTKLLASIENATGVRLRASELLRQPDLRGIATLLHSHGGVGKREPVQPVMTEQGEK